MDAISLLMVLFLNLNEPCTAMPAELQHVSGQDYQILRYACGAKAYKIWQRKCNDGQGYWGRPFFLEEENSQQGLYVNRFGEVVTGYHVSITETYVPLCGS